MKKLIGVILSLSLITVSIPAQVIFAEEGQDIAESTISYVEDVDPGAFSEDYIEYEEPAAVSSADEVFSDEVIWEDDYSSSSVEEYVDEGVIQDDYITDSFGDETIQDVNYEEPVITEDFSVIEDQSETGVQSDEEISDFIVEGDILTAYTGKDSIVIIPDGIRVIGETAFIGNEFVEEIYVSDTVEEIQFQAFADCKNLTKIYLGENSSLKKIGEEAFINDTKLDISFASEDMEVSESAFAGIPVEETKEQETAEPGLTAAAEPIQVSDEAQYAVSSVPVITVQPETQTVAAGETVVFTVEAADAESYQWQIDRADGNGFVDLATTSQWKGTTTPSFSFKALAARERFTFRVVVSNSVGETISDEVKQIIGGAPVITVQPETQTVAAGETVVFTVEATDADSYQWQIDRDDGKGFVNLATTSQWKGTTTPSFSFKALAARELFTFRVVVGNSIGETISDEVRMVIGGGIPVITTQPETQIVEAGETVVFSVEATNAEAYQWQIDRGDGKGFVNLATTAQWKGTTTDTFSFKAMAARENYTFRVVVSNSAGEVISNEVNQIIAEAQQAPVITVQPQNQTADAGDMVEFTVTATDAETYQWQIDRNDGKGFVNLASSTQWIGTTTATFSFKAIKGRDVYTFRAVVSNSAGEAVSDEVKVILGTAPVITTQPVNQTAAAGETVEFTVAATDAESYQWQIDRNDGKGFVNLTSSTQWIGTTTATFSFKAVKGRDAYTFRAVVKNTAGETISDEVKVIIGSAPVITNQPESQNVMVGEMVQFTVTATDAETYQWQIDRADGKGFVDLATTSQWMGTTTATFKFKALKAREDFSFRVVVSNNAGETISDVVNFTTCIVVDDVQYEEIGDSCLRVVSYAGSASAVTIPETIEAKTVTEIGEEAFMGNTTLESIDLPDTITIIRARAFKNCTNLKSMS